MDFHLRKAAQDVVGVPISGAFGGDGYVCRVVGRQGVSMKIHNEPVPTNLDPQLEYQMLTPPATILKQTAWPQDIVEDSRGGAVGYLQQHFSPGFVPFTAVASRPTRPGWASDKTLRQCAYQAAYLLAELHAYDYLYPDIHAEQFLVDSKPQIVLIDMGSCQFTNNGTLYPCRRARPEYQAPELLGFSNWEEAAHRRDVYTDSWSLAVLLFELTVGCHPFDGVHVGVDKYLSPAERAKHGQFPFHRSCRDYRPPPNAPPYRRVDPDLQDLFFRCFVDGHRHEDRHARPLPGEWADVLRHCRKLIDQPSPAVPNVLPTPSTSTGSRRPRATLSRVLRRLRLLRRRSRTALACVTILLVACIGSYYFRPSQRDDPARWYHPPRSPPLLSPKPNRNIDIDNILDRLRRKNTTNHKENVR